MAKMNLSPASELVDEVWGKIGTPERDEMEARLKEEHESLSPVKATEERGKLATFEELQDRYLGKIGTPERDAYEAEVREAIQSYHIGEAIKTERKDIMKKPADSDV